MKVALIVGAQGQDGQILKQRLNTDGAEVVSINRGDIALGDLAAVRSCIKSRPDEVYYLAAHHHSSQDRMGTDDIDLYHKSMEVHAEGLLSFLESIRQHSPQTRLFYAASSLIYGESQTDTQDETTPLAPRCIYAITKAAGLHLCRFYREKHGIYASVGILFNHESPLRQRKFVIPKIIEAAIAIANGSKSKLQLGDLSARVDWGYAPDYVDAMTRILRLPYPDDFVVATGETHSVQEVVEIIFGLLNLNWLEHVKEIPEILARKRPVLCGDSNKLRESTGWSPTISFQKMLKLLLKARCHE
jgi:GDPmannose 4,6-dehydratase